MTDPLAIPPGEPELPKFHAYFVPALVALEDGQAKQTRVISEVADELELALLRG